MGHPRDPAPGAENPGDFRENTDPGDFRKNPEDPRIEIEKNNTKSLSLFFCEKTFFLLTPRARDASVQAERIQKFVFF